MHGQHDQVSASGAEAGWWDCFTHCSIVVHGTRLYHSDTAAYKQWSTSQGKQNCYPAGCRVPLVTTCIFSMYSMAGTVSNTYRQTQVTSTFASGTRPLQPQFT